MRFSRQEYWSGLPFPSPRDRTQESNPGLLPCRQILSQWSYKGSPTGKSLNLFWVCFQKLCILPRGIKCRRLRFDSWVRKIHWRSDRLPIPVSWALLVIQLVKNLPAMWETWVWSLGWEDPWRRERLPTPVFWLGEFHELYSPWGCKESDMTEQLSLHTVN